MAAAASAAARSRPTYPIPAARHPIPAGGLYSTGADQARFYRMMLGGGQLDGKRVLSAEGVKAMTSVQTGELKTGFVDGMGFGYGFGVVREPRGTTAALSAGSYGHGGRYGTYCFIDPERDLIGIFMIHREGGSDERQAFVAMAESAVVE